MRTTHLSADVPEGGVGCSAFRISEGIHDSTLQGFSGGRQPPHLPGYPDPISGNRPEIYSLSQYRSLVSFVFVTARLPWYHCQARSSNLTASKILFHCVFLSPHFDFPPCFEPNHNISFYTLTLSLTLIYAQPKRSALESHRTITANMRTHLRSPATSRSAQPQPPTPTLDLTNLSSSF